LPPELTLSSEGVLRGTPAAPGAHAFDLQVTDSAPAPARVTAHFELTVQPLLRLATQASLPVAINGESYSETLSTTGGIAPTTYSLDGGALPPGLALSSGGTLSGTPTQTGMSTFVVETTDSSEPPQRSTRSYSLEVKPLSTTLEIATRSLADGRTDWSYSQKLKATGGSAPYTWKVIGALPPGLSLSDNTTVGVISGAPTSKGSFNVTVEVTDSVVGTHQQSFPLEVF
jgi:hypothetical protein